jgi:hypothetical protein
MRKTVLFILSVFLLIGCLGCGTYGTKRFYVNGESYLVPNVRFLEHYVTLPLEDVLQLIGAESSDNSVWRLNNHYFIIDYKKHLLLMEDDTGYVEYLQRDKTKYYERWSSRNSILPLENEYNDDYYVGWGTAVIVVDHKTLIDIVHNAGIILQVDMDYENEVVYLVTIGRCQD